MIEQILGEPTGAKRKMLYRATWGLFCLYAVQIPMAFIVPLESTLLIFIVAHGAFGTAFFGHKLWQMNQWRKANGGWE